MCFALTGNLQVNTRCLLTAICNTSEAFTSNLEVCRIDVEQYMLHLTRAERLMFTNDLLDKRSKVWTAIYTYSFNGERLMKWVRGPPKGKEHAENQFVIQKAYGRQNRSRPSFAGQQILNLAGASLPKLASGLLGSVSAAVKAAVSPGLCKPLGKIKKEQKPKLLQ